jgi:hypothetical protein
MIYLSRRNSSMADDIHPREDLGDSIFRLIFLFSNVLIKSHVSKAKFRFAEKFIINQVFQLSSIMDDIRPFWMNIVFLGRKSKD